MIKDDGCLMSFLRSLNNSTGTPQFVTTHLEGLDHSMVGSRPKTCRTLWGGVRPMRTQCGGKQTKVPRGAGSRAQNISKDGPTGPSVTYIYIFF